MKTDNHNKAIDLRKLTLWHTIDWYVSSVGTEHEQRERKVLDQAIDTALYGTDVAQPVADDWLPLISFADIAAKFPTYPWEVADDQHNDYRVIRVAPTVDETLIIWVEKLRYAHPEDAPVGLREAAAMALEWFTAYMGGDEDVIEAANCYDELHDALNRHATKGKANG